mmetsp:Transcript_36067/g.44021  ORF Transcript_36067/g.44021 Transcript_36067/m.44021 type:complete len:342 (+) Transcript_36067:159-1184(+)
MQRGWLRQLRSDDGVVDILVDTADALAASHTNLDVALVAPGGVPGVSHDVVTLGAFVAVADSEDGVVHTVGAAVSLSHDTARVVAEDVVAGRDGDVDGADVEGSLDGFSFLVDLLVGAHVGDTLGGIVGAPSLLAGDTGSVGVVRLSHGLVVLEPLVGVVVPATSAAMVGEQTLGAIDELLRRHDDLLVAGKDICGLNSLGGGEGPAGAALALVLDGGNDTHDVSPVERLAVGDVSEGEHGLLSLVVHVLETEHGLVLLVCPVGHVVEGELQARLPLVLELNLGELGAEDSEAALPLLNSLVDSVVLSGPLHEVDGHVGGAESLMDVGGKHFSELFLINSW